MENNILVTDYKLQKFNFSRLHSTGSKLYFGNPCIGYIKKGSAKFLHKGRTLYASSGDLIYIPYKTEYQSVWYGSPEIEWFSINLSFKSKYAFVEYPFQIIKNFPDDLFDKIYDTYQTSPLMSVSFLYQLLDDMYKKMKPLSPHLNNTIIQPAIEYIENNYNKNLSVDTLAKLCHLSESGFFKQFKKTTGVTPIKYKHNIMIQHALDLLAHTTISIEDISTLVGFTSSNYFRTVFSKFTYKTPKEVRKSSQ